METINNTDSGYTTPRDTFLYLLSLVTLVVSAVMFGMLVYQYIDLKFPDPLRFQYGYYSASSAYSTIRTAIATLVVVFPVFFWVSRALRNDVVNHPEKRNLKIRRWLLYLIVFAASLVAIGDLVVLIRSFLEGELTTPFILKVLTILFIAGSSLFYYLSELRDRQYPRRLFQGVMIAVVTAAVVYGFVLAGSPQSQRLVRFDDQKISNLEQIQSQVINYWQLKGVLPPTLDSLKDPISGFMLPVDPQTGEAYEYHVTGKQAFQLCAMFNRDTIDPKSAVPAIYPYYNWQHGPGRVCFDRTIDAQLYPVNSGKPVPAR